MALRILICVSNTNVCVCVCVVSLCVCNVCNDCRSHEFERGVWEHEQGWKAEKEGGK